MDAKARSDGRRTRIIATLGPASESAEMIEALAAAGMDVARLNFSHAGHAEVARAVARIRALPPTSPVRIMGDLPGPKLRIGELEAPLQLEARQPLALVRGESDPPDSIRAPDVLFAGGALDASTSVYLQDGLIELEVTRRAPSRIDTVVVAGGTLAGRAGLAVPEVELGLPALTDDDRRDLRFAVEQGLEYLALSFVASAADMAEARELLAEAGGEGTRLVAKIERRAALDDLDGLAVAADALMVARGDLGVAVGVEEVPVWQHRIIAAGRRHGTPVIVATEMLESMRTRRRPTRAEASDIAHAVWDGASAVMLSAETAVGQYPVEVVETMARIVRRAEEEFD